MPAAFGEGQVTEFVEYQQIGPRELVGEPSRLAIAGVGFEAVDQIDDVEETGLGAAADAVGGDGDGEVGFAGAAGYRGFENENAAFFLFRTLLRLMRRWVRGGCRGGPVRVVDRGSRRVLARGRRGVLAVAGGAVS